jgi:hypothetical protein
MPIVQYVISNFLEDVLLRLIEVTIKLTLVRACYCEAECYFLNADTSAQIRMKIGSRRDFPCKFP